MSDRPSTSVSQTSTIDESLSAMVDGEASELEVRRLLKLMDEDPALKARWERYQMASNAINNDIPNAPYLDLSASISAAIDQETAYEAGKSDTVDSAQAVSSRKTGFWSGFGRFAIAASVAGAVVLGIQYGTTDINNPTVADSTIGEQPGNNVVSLPPQGSSVTTVSAGGSSTPIQHNRQPIVITDSDLERAENARKNAQEVQQQLNRLMLEHVQNTSQNTQQGVLPYARVPAGEE